MSKVKKSGGDLNQVAKSIVDQVTEKDGDVNNINQKNPAAVALGRLGGLKGGTARANKLSPEQRSEIARKAAQKRWGKKK